MSPLNTTYKSRIKGVKLLVVVGSTAVSIEQCLNKRTFRETHPHARVSGSSKPWLREGKGGGGGVLVEDETLNDRERKRKLVPPPPLSPYTEVMLGARSRARFTSCGRKCTDCASTLTFCKCSKDFSDKKMENCVVKNNHGQTGCRPAGQGLNSKTYRRARAGPTPCPAR